MKTSDTVAVAPAPVPVPAPTGYKAGAAINHGVVNVVTGVGKGAAFVGKTIFNFGRGLIGR